MIQPAAALSLSALAQSADAVAQAASEGTEGADFGALLALQGLGALADGTAAVPSAALPGQTDKASPPASPGKMLPPALPFEPGTELVGQAASAPPVSAPTKFAAQILPPSRRFAKVHEGDGSTAGISASEERGDPREIPNPEFGLPFVQANAAGPMAAVAAAQPVPPQVAAAEFISPDLRSSSGYGDPARPTSIVPETVSPGTMRRSTNPVRVVELPQTHDLADPAPTSRTVTTLSPAAPAEEVRVALALPRGLAAIKAGGDAKAAPLERVAVAQTETATIAMPPSTPATPAPMPALHTAPQIRPHDFAALIDRLSVAREAAQPQAVSITVSHQDFGPVRLHFRPEDAGLTVAMSSADPDFARAAATAPAPIRPVSAATEMSFGQSRDDTASGQPGPQTGGNQSRGSFAGQRESHGQPRTNPSPRGQQLRPAPRPGIFA